MVLRKAFALAGMIGSMVLCGTAPAAAHPVDLEDLDGVTAGEAAVLSTLDLSADGRLLAVERGGALAIVDVASGRSVQKLGEGLNPRWSPDGKQLAFYSRRSGTLQLWLWNGGTPRQLTRLPDGIDADIETRIMGYIGDAFRYSWSPRGDRIAFPSRLAFHVPQTKTAGAPLVLTTATPPNLTLQDVFAHPGGGTGGVVEAPNGRDLAFRKADPRETLFNQIFVVDVRTGKALPLTQERATSFDPAWSPDGRTLAYARVRANDDNASADIIAAKEGEIVLFDLATRRARLLDSASGIKFQPRWSPDGKKIAYLASSSFESEAGIRIAGDAAGAEAEIKLAGPVVGYDWDRRSGDGFLVSYGSDGDSASKAPANPQVRDVAGLGHEVSQLIGPWSQDGRGDIAWIENEAGPDLWLSAADQKQPRKLLSLTTRSDLEFAKSEHVTWRSAHNELLEGELLYPLNYVKGRHYPLIVDVYPFPASTDWMNPMSGNQAWASTGYMVFKPGPRAPHSAPNCSALPAFCKAGEGPAGLNVMVDDVMSGIAELDRRGLIDRNRMCLYGHSNGGGVVDYLVTRTDAFKCAVAVAPVLPNWFGTPFLWYESFGLLSHLAGAAPWQNPEAYMELSAALHADKVKTPMLLADGDEDGAFLLGSIEMYNALRATGDDVTLLRYPDQGHTLTGTALRDFWRREKAFFAAHLKTTSAN